MVVGPEARHAGFGRSDELLSPCCKRSQRDCVWLGVIVRSSLVGFSILVQVLKVLDVVLRRSVEAGNALGKKAFTISSRKLSSSYGDTCWPSLRKHSLLQWKEPCVFITQAGNNSLGRVNSQQAGYNCNSRAGPSWEPNPTILLRRTCYASFVLSMSISARFSKTIVAVAEKIAARSGGTHNIHVSRGHEARTASKMRSWVRSDAKCYGNVTRLSSPLDFLILVFSCMENTPCSRDRLPFQDRALEEDSLTEGGSTAVNPILRGDLAWNSVQEKHHDGR